VLITLSSVTPAASISTCTDKSTLFCQNFQRHCSVKFNKQFQIVCLSNDFTSTLCCSTAVRTDFTAPLYHCLVTLQVYVLAVIFRDIYFRFTSNVTRVDKVSDVTSVNTVLHQCTGKVVRLNIQFEITNFLLLLNSTLLYGTGTSDGAM